MSASAIDKLLSSVPQKAVPLTQSKELSELAKTLMASNSPSPDVHAVLNQCATLRYCVDKPNDIPEPLWRLAIGAVQFCSNGRQAAHDISKGHHKYSPEETDEKLDNWPTSAGPSTCEKFREVTGNKCDGCQHPYKSPVALVQIQRESSPVSNEAPKAALMTLNEAKNRPSIKWRVKNVMPEIGTGSVFGPSGTGKSFVILDMLHNICTGESWFGRKTVMAPVVYIALEGGGGISARLKALEKKYNAEPDNFFVYIGSLNLGSSDDVDWLTQLVLSDIGCGAVICIDTLAQSMPGLDENSAKDTGIVLHNLTKLSLDTQSFVCVVHHTGKDKTKGMRGSSSMRGAFDMTLYVNKSGSAYSWSSDKIKDGPDDEIEGFELVQVKVDTDDDGQKVTSCYVDPLAINLTAKQQLPTGANQRAVLKALTSLIAANAGDICEDTLIKATKPLIDGDRKPARIKQGINGLIQGGFITVEDGYYKIKS